MRLLPWPVDALSRQASGLASFLGSPGTQIFIKWRAWYFIHACTTSMFTFQSVGAWEQDYKWLRYFLYFG